MSVFAVRQVHFLDDYDDYSIYDPWEYEDTSSHGFMCDCKSYYDYEQELKDQLWADWDAMVEEQELFDAEPLNFPDDGDDYEHLPHIQSISDVNTYWEKMHARRSKNKKPRYTTDWYKSA